MKQNCKRRQIFLEHMYLDPQATRRQPRDNQFAQNSAIERETRNVFLKEQENEHAASIVSRHPAPVQQL